MSHILILRAENLQGNTCIGTTAQTFGVAYNDIIDPGTSHGVVFEIAFGTRDRLYILDLDNCVELHVHTI